MIQTANPELELVEVKREVRRSILLVDDDEDQLALLEYRLERLGFRTIRAAAGNDAVRTAHAAHPDLILLDLRLPDADGLQICRELTDAPDTCDIPVIIVSAVESPDIVRASRAAGCHFYVRKPYDPNVLFTLIQETLLDSA